MVLTLQSVFKHALTEGDKIVLSAASNLYDQGVYALAHNYGSFVRHGMERRDMHPVFTLVPCRLHVLNAGGTWYSRDY